MIGALQLFGSDNSFRNFNSQGEFDLVIDESTIDPKQIDPNSLFLNDSEFLSLWNLDHSLSVNMSKTELFVSAHSMFNPARSTKRPLCYT